MPFSIWPAHLMWKMRMAEEMETGKSPQAGRRSPPVQGSNARTLGLREAPLRRPVRMTLRAHWTLRYRRWTYRPKSQAGTFMLALTVFISISSKSTKSSKSTLDSSRLYPNEFSQLKARFAACFKLYTIVLVQFPELCNDCLFFAIIRFQFVEVTISNISRTFR